jgi:hypothetical protein
VTTLFGIVYLIYSTTDVASLLATSNDIYWLSNLAPFNTLSVDLANFPP